MVVTFQVEGGDFSRAGYASSHVKRMLKELGVAPGTIKKVVVALYEAEVNIVAHAYRGCIEVAIDEHSITAILKDEGPGIPDIAQAMQKGFSTASPAVREMGFGAGMGLPNISENADEFDIRTEQGSGTTLTIRINL